VDSPKGKQVSCSFLKPGPGTSFLMYYCRITSSG
jgi:hypothetical protein